MRAKGGKGELALSDFTKGPAPAEFVVVPEEVPESPPGEESSRRAATPASKSAMPIAARRGDFLRAEAIHR